MRFSHQSFPVVLISSSVSLLTVLVALHMDIGQHASLSLSASSVKKMAGSEKHAYNGGILDQTEAAIGPDMALGPQSAQVCSSGKYISLYKR